MDTINLGKAPCFHCDARCVNCHSTCVKYQKYSNRRKQYLKDKNNDLETNRWTYTAIRMADRERKKRLDLKHPGF